ncbi:MAG: acyl-ACP--UDP-N-acetylglucosamine O-acyltransferase [Candidatus Neomarinimicrobiota bacterium]
MENNLSTNIHPTAIVDSRAELGSGVTVGPYAVIEGSVTIGDGTTIMAQAHVLNGTTMGQDCRIFQGAVIGGESQDLKYDGADTLLKIGDRTTIREYATVGRGTRAEDPGTRIGSDTLLMGYAHIGHDCIIGDQAIIANYVGLGGHTEIHDWASIGAGTLIHQFCHIGTHSFVGAGYRVVQDVPPYILAAGEPLRYAGINIVGLKRRGFSTEVHQNLKRAYRLIFRSSYNRQQTVEIIKSEMGPSPEIQTVLAFIEQSTRGLI